MKVPALRLNAKSILIVALLLIFIVAVISGIDLISGGWGQPTPKHPI
jgi:hypothetical protein